MAHSYAATYYFLFLEEKQPQLQFQNFDNMQVAGVFWGEINSKSPPF